MLGYALIARLALAASSAAAPPQAHNGKVIVRLVSRHNEIHVLAASNGVRYSANDKDGRIITANATLDELKQQHPDLYRQVTAPIVVSADAPVPYAGIAGD
jgi:hypothetical protein